MSGALSKGGGLVGGTPPPFPMYAFDKLTIKTKVFKETVELNLIPTDTIFL